MLTTNAPHKGVAPARLVARLRMQFQEKGFSPALADLMAPHMSADEGISEELEIEINRLLNFLNSKGIAGEQAKKLISDALQDMSDDTSELTGSIEVDEGDEEEDEITASWSRRGKPHKSLLARVMATVHKQTARPQTRARPPISRDQILNGSRHRGASMSAALSDALLSRVDRRHEPTIGAQYASLSLAEMAMLSAKASGERPASLREAVRMATHTTSDFPKILGGTLGQSVARQMEQIVPALQRAAHEVSVENYRAANLLSLSASGVPQEIGEGGEIKHVTIDERGEQKPAPRDFGSLFRLSNHAIINDDLGMFDQISRQMVAGATERFRRVLLEPLVANSGLGHNMSDGKPVFHADHRNLASVGSALDVASLSAGRLALRTQKGSQGELYAIDPWALVVPPHLETQAQQLLAEINATKTADVNPFSGSLELIVEAGLTDPKAWYLIGNPSKTDGLAYSFLDGQSAPLVETKPGWETLGLEFRLVWALDARFVNYASWYKNPGVAG